MALRKSKRYERYELADSIWAQDPTQKDLASIVRMTKDHLEALVRDKEAYITRRSETIGGKARQLTIPVGKLRRVHERFKFQLNKIKQPEYLYSPRKGRAQRDNAAIHAGGTQFLQLDVRQFYPKTMQEDIFRWAYHSLAIRDDVAGLFAKLVAIDGRMPFGSPISPVLTSLIHRDMFDRVYALCEEKGLRMSLWVDDLTISGREVTGDVVARVRQMIRDGGFQTHKIELTATLRPTIVTGVPVANGRVLAPRALHRRIQEGFAKLRAADGDAERANCIDVLLGLLGNYRYHLGASTSEGRRAADQMHALKQRRSKLRITATTEPDATAQPSEVIVNGDVAPWD